jgi:RNA polymerase sigma-70 factor (ECF subfamily)
MNETTRGDIELLVERASAGERAAFSELTKRLMKPVVALTYRMTGDRDAAFDLAQDTFVTAWQKLASFRGEAKFESWLYRIASNKTLNYLKSQKRMDTESDTVEIEAQKSAGPDAVFEREELRRRVLQFMHTLPDQQRLIFDLRFYRELQFHEIAGITGKALGTVKTLYRESLKKLRSHALAKGWTI